MPTAALWTPTQIADRLGIWITCNNMAEQATPRKHELYQVIVKGAMNAVLHHPLWYRELTSVVFQKLEHTPITAFGYDFVFDRPTATSEVGALLSSQVIGNRLGISVSKTGSADVVLHLVADDLLSRRILVRQGDVSSAHVIIANHSEYKMPEGSGFVELTVTLKRHFESELRLAREQADRVVAAIDSWEIKNV